MNHLQYRRKLEIQMYLYIDFLPFVPKVSEEYSKNEVETMTFKLLDEIQFLKLRIMKLDRMNVCQSRATVIFKPSKLVSKMHKV